MAYKIKVPAICSFVCDVCKEETINEDYPSGWHRITACESWRGDIIILDVCYKHFDGSNPNTLGVMIEYRLKHLKD